MFLTNHPMQYSQYSFRGSWQNHHRLHFTFRCGLAELVWDSLTTSTPGTWFALGLGSSTLPAILRGVSPRNAVRTTGISHHRPRCRVIRPPPRRPPPISTFRLPCAVPAIPRPPSGTPPFSWRTHRPRPLPTASALMRYTRHPRATSPWTSIGRAVRDLFEQ
jgi:hypothetical protein